LFRYTACISWVDYTSCKWNVMAIWRLLTIIFFTILMVHIAPVHAQQIATIPLDGQRIPSDDLEFQGRMLRPDEAYRLANEGVNLSELDPVSSEVWEPQVQSPSART